MAPPAPPRRRGAPGACRAGLLAVAAVVVAAAGWLGRCASSFVAYRGPGPHRSARTARQADGQVVSMKEAGVYMPVVDPITAELDLSNIPDEMGVYAVYDDRDRLQYIGLSRQMSKSIEGHAKAIGAADAGRLISSVRCLEMAGQSKELLKSTWEKWIKEHMDAGGEIPAGNLPESAPGADPRWRNKGPDSSRPPLNLAGTRGITSPAEALEVVRDTVKKYPVVFFMKGTPMMPQCGFSARSIGILKQIGVPFESVNVLDGEANPGIREAVKQFSNWPTIPQLFIDGELVGGADIIAEMHSNGKLQPRLKSAGAGKPSQEGAGRGGTATAVAVRGDIRLIDDPRRPMASLMSRKLSESFDLYGLRIMDQSSQHEGDSEVLAMGLSGESHFKVEIVAPDFDGLSPVQRQQKVFTALSDVMPRIHALSLVTQTPGEVA